MAIIRAPDIPETGRLGVSSGPVDMAPRDEPSAFAALLRRCRQAAGLSQEELAELAGLSRRGISDLLLLLLADGLFMVVPAAGGACRKYEVPGPRAGLCPHRTGATVTMPQGLARRSEARFRRVS
jgi:Helix-turn-helix domain